MSAQHSSDTPEHGTPPKFVELVHATFGRPSVDPCSSAEWNRLVGAHRVITESENGLHTPWFIGAPAPNRMLTNTAEAPEHHGCWTAMVNPPGERTGELVARFWCALAEYFHRRWCTSGIWIGFNVEQLARLQRVGARSHPLQHVTLVPAKRENYRPSPRSLDVGEDAPHASFVTLLSRDPLEIERFVALGSQLGHVINGDRR